MKTTISIASVVGFIVGFVACVLLAILLGCYGIHWINGGAGWAHDVIIYSKRWVVTVPAPLVLLYFTESFRRAMRAISIAHRQWVVEDEDMDQVADEDLAKFRR